MNTPTLTMKNNSCMFRCGESINKNLNMEDWIANDEEDYVNKGVFFQIRIFKKIKKKINIQNKNSVLFDSERFSNEFIKMLSEII